MKVYKVTQEQMEVLERGGQITKGGVVYVYEPDAFYQVTNPHVESYNLHSDDGEFLELRDGTTVLSSIKVPFASRSDFAVNSTHAHSIKNDDGKNSLNYNYLTCNNKLKFYDSAVDEECYGAVINFGDYADDDFSYAWIGETEDDELHYSATSGHFFDNLVHINNGILIKGTIYNEDESDSISVDDIIAKQNKLLSVSESRSANGNITTVSNSFALGNTSRTASLTVATNSTDDSGVILYSKTQRQMAPGRQITSEATATLSSNTFTLDGCDLVMPNSNGYDMKLTTEYFNLGDETDPDWKNGIGITATDDETKQVTFWTETQWGDKLCGNCGLYFSGEVISETQLISGNNIYAYGNIISEGSLTTGNGNLIHGTYTLTLPDEQGILATRAYVDSHTGDDTDSVWEYTGNHWEFTDDYCDYYYHYYWSEHILKSDRTIKKIKLHVEKYLKMQSGSTTDYMTANTALHRESRSVIVGTMYKWYTDNEYNGLRVRGSKFPASYQLQVLFNDYIMNVINSSSVITKGTVSTDHYKFNNNGMTVYGINESTASSLILYMNNIELDNNYTGQLYASRWSSDIEWVTKKTGYNM